MFGVGYVGSISAACLARDGHSVIAVDPNLEKVEKINAGSAPIVEAGLQVLIQSSVAAGRLRATPCAQEAVASSDVSIICVGTPSQADDGLDVSAVERVAATIGEGLGRKAAFHTVVVRSTLPPGTIQARIAPAIERAAGLKAGEGFGLAYYPEFLREGTALADYDDPDLVVLAASDQRTLAQLTTLLPPAAPAPRVVSFAEAEAIKTVRNVWRAVKVSFANEVGGVLDGLGVDSHRVMAVVRQDGSPDAGQAYLTPGFAFGGSCLPKDLRAFSALGAAADRPTPLLKAALAMNQRVIDRAVALVEAAGGRRVSIIGLSFKPGTDDLRESPFLILAARLAARGFDLRLFDPCVCAHRLTGANRAHALQSLPQISSLLCESLEAAVRHGETLILAHAGPGEAALRRAAPTTRIVDLVRVRADLRSAGSYAGLFW